MTQEERTAILERIVKDQFANIIAQGSVVCAKDDMFTNMAQYLHYAGVVNGGSMDLPVSDAQYWDVVKKLAADNKNLIATDNEVKTAD